MSVVLLFFPAEPQQAGTGRLFIPLIHAPRMRRAGSRRGDGKRHGCNTQRHGKRLHPRGGLPWILFLYVFFLSLL